MSEFGNETATAVMKLSEKSLEALLKLLKFLMQKNERALNSKLKKEELENIKNQKQKQKIIEYLDKTRGYARMKHLLKSGEKLVPIGTSLSLKEQKRFNHYAKISGLTYSSISDKRVMEKIKLVKDNLKELKSKCSDGESKFSVEKLSDDDKLKFNNLTKELEELETQRTNRILIVREKDLELVKDITDRMNRDIYINDIENEINDIKSKDNISKEDEEKIEKLEKEKSQICDMSFEKFNEKSNTAILEKDIENSMYEHVDFNKALIEVTGRINKEPYIVCERTIPQNYMEITSKQETSDKGYAYVNTEFKVYNQNVQQKCDEFKHGKFTHYSDSKGNNTSSYGDSHWENMKKEMKLKGGFTNDLLIFKNKEQYEKYVEQYRKMIERVTSREDTISYEADSNSFKDCMGIINRLQGELADHNIALNAQRELCNATTKSVIHYDKNMSDDERYSYILGKNLVNRISNLEKMNDIQNKIAFTENDKLNDITQFEKYGKPKEMLEQHNNIQREYDCKIEELKCQYQETVERDKQLSERQNAIESINIVSFVSQEAKESEMIELQTKIKETNDVDYKTELHDMQNISTQNIEQWEKDINNNRTINTKSNTKSTNVKNVEHSRE